VSHKVIFDLSHLLETAVPPVLSCYYFCMYLEIPIFSLAYPLLSSIF